MHGWITASQDFHNRSWHRIRISPGEEEVELLDVPLKGRNMWQAWGIMEENMETTVVYWGII